MQTFYKPNNNAEIEHKIITFLTLHELQIDDIDVVITGKNGDLKNDQVYTKLNLSLLRNSALANYKHLCGEYPTSSAFALWLASNILKKQEVPPLVKERKIKNSPPKTILILIIT